MSHIKWRSKDVESVKKLVRSYNAKILRLKKKGYDVDLLPEKTTYTEIKNKVGTREELNRELELLKTFTTRYSEKISKKSTRGANLPLYMERQIKIKLDNINKERKKQKKLYEKLPKTDRNKPIHERNNAWGNEKLQELEPREFKFKNMSRKELDMFLNSISNYDEKYSKKNELYRANFYKAIENVLGWHDFERIKAVLDQMSTDEIVAKYYTDENMDIDFIYEKIDKDTIFNETLESWSSVLADNLKEAFVVE